MDMFELFHVKPMFVCILKDRFNYSLPIGNMCDLFAATLGGVAPGGAAWEATRRDWRGVPRG